MAGPFKDSPVAAYLRQDFSEAVRQVTDPSGDYKVEGSAGAGQWARSPWVAIFDPLITDTAQRGYYPVYLVREDFSGVYLSLNQGVTEVRNRYPGAKDAKEALRGRAGDIRARLGNPPEGHSVAPINLRPSSPQNNSAFYEAGNICSAFYDVHSIPVDAQLNADLTAVLKAYSFISDADPDLSSVALEEDEPITGAPFDEDHTRFRKHKMIERNPKVSRLVKSAQGLVCPACGFDFRTAYPGLENPNYIEAHHLIPISQLKGQRVRSDPNTDFAVLCSNCHRMIHRFPEPWDLAGFKKTLVRRC